VAKREAFEAWMTTTDSSRLVFLDETGCNIQLVPEYGWSMRGQRLIDRRPGGHWKNVSVVGAIRRDKVLCHSSFEGALNTARWLEFLEKKLCPTLNPGDIVVMDNLSVHKNSRGIELIREAGADVKFQPPYSPEFNPIELTWSFVKHVLRKLRATTTQLLKRGVWRALLRVTTRHLEGWFRHSGYNVQ